MNESKMVTDAGVNFNNGLRMNRAAAERCEPQLQHGTTIQIPKTMSTGPFLQHAALTPAQKDYLYTIAASYSTAHVRNLITQHYMNVLQRCVRAGARTKLLEEDEEEEDERLDDSLSECLSSLCVGQWDDDTLSDL
ncbi:hypothetical protein ABVT39_006637 [Epinephelus coioides]